MDWITCQEQPRREKPQRPTGSPPMPAPGASAQSPGPVWDLVPAPLRWAGSCHVRLCSPLPASQLLAPRWMLGLAFETPAPTPIQHQGCPQRHLCQAVPLLEASAGIHRSGGSSLVSRISFSPSGMYGWVTRLARGGRGRLG